MSQFMFATGIENSYPTIEWKGKTIRQDELAKTKHYVRWRELPLDRPASAPQQ